MSIITHKHIKLIKHVIIVHGLHHKIYHITINNNL
jgi:hypothetical protein